MEANLNWLLERLLRCSPDVRRAVVDATGVSLPTRCELILKLSSINPPAQEWFLTLEEKINAIKNEICPLRNRLIHDPWIVTASEPIQHDARAFLAKEQSHAETKISPPKEPERSLQSMWNLVRLINDVNFRLVLLHSDLERFQKTGRYEGIHKQSP